ncbi:MAG: AAA family ATPase [Phycisphaerae bacterium]
MSDRKRLTALIRGRHACIRIVTSEEAHALGLVRDAALDIGGELCVWSVVQGVRQDSWKPDGGSDGEPISAPQTENPAAGLVHLLQVPALSICVTLDLAPHLSDSRVLRLLREVIHGFHAKNSQLIMIDHGGEAPPVIVAESTRFDISLPNDDELHQIIRDTLQRANREHQVEVKITRGEFRTILQSLRGLSRRQVEQIISDAVIDDRRFDFEDVPTILAGKRRALQSEGLLEFVECPVSLDEIGGLRRLKAWLKQRRHGFSAKAVEFGLTAPRGVLMLGVQGAGKSLCAKAIATAWQRPLMRMDVGALYDRYIGESERRLRETLRQAEAMAPIILWIDEIEKAFAAAASRSSDGGLSQRMFGQLLTWMQEHDAPVFLVATANDIEALPPELLRKGRFDEIFFVDLPGEATRKEILAIHLRKRQRDPATFDIDRLAAAADGFSGAEIEQAIVSALHAAFSDKTELDTERIIRALESSPPLSVTMAEKVEALQMWAQHRCVPAD